jgi:hypothetical protein
MLAGLRYFERVIKEATMSENDAEKEVITKVVEHFIIKYKI